MGTFKRGRNSFHARCRATGDGSCQGSAGDAERGPSGYIFRFIFSDILCYVFGSNLESRLCVRTATNRDSENSSRYANHRECGECTSSSGQSDR